jgi:hypothetical protein
VLARTRPMAWSRDRGMQGQVILIPARVVQGGRQRHAQARDRRLPGRVLRGEPAGSAPHAFGLRARSLASSMSGGRERHDTQVPHGGSRRGGPRLGRQGRRRPGQCARAGGEARGCHRSAAAPRRGSSPTRQHGSSAVGRRCCSPPPAGGSSVAGSTSFGARSHELREAPRPAARRGGRRPGTAGVSARRAGCRA